MTKRQQQAECTKQRLIDTCKRLVAEKGYEITVDEIVQTCGVAKGTFYHYFSSKDDMLEAIEFKPYDDIRAKLRSEKPLPISETLLTYLRLWLEKSQYFGADYNRRWVMRAASAKPEAAAHCQERMEYDLHALTDYLQAARADGQLLPETPIEQIAQSLWLLLYGATLYRACRDNEFFSRSDWLDTLFQHEIGKLLAPYLCSESPK